MAAPVPAPAERLVELVRRFRGVRLVALVDLVVDEFVHGDIERVSREAPVLILRQRRVEVVPGGGGNTVANLRSLGADPVPVGVLGRDEPAERLLERFRRLGIRTSAIVRDRTYATPAKSRVVAGGVHTRRQQVVRVDRGAVPGDLPAATRERLLARAGPAARGAAGLIVADYGYGAATPELLARMRRVRALARLPLTVDSRTRVAGFRNVSACTPNQEELERALGGAPLADEGALERAGKQLLRLARARAVLLTRGARGVSLFEPRRRTLHVPAFGPDEVADVTGAGDTVSAAFSLARLAGGTFADAARIANCAAGLVVQKAGTATVDAAELIAAIREGGAA